MRSTHSASCIMWFLLAACTTASELPTPSVEGPARKTESDSERLARLGVVTRTEHARYTRTIYRYDRQGRKTNVAYWRREGNGEFCPFARETWIRDGNGAVVLVRRLDQDRKVVYESRRRYRAGLLTEEVWWTTELGTKMSFRQVYRYDGDRRLLKEIHYNKFEQTSVYEKTYEYGARGRLVRTVSTDHSSQTIHRFVYDTSGRKVREWDESDRADEKRWRYNSRDQVTFHFLQPKNEEAQTYHYHYDTRGLLTLRTHLRAGVTHRIRYTYGFR